MIEVNQSTIQEFIKLLIECSDTYELLPDHTIRCKVDGQIQTVMSGTTPKPIMVFYEGAPCNQDVVWLNPFKENNGVCKAREWFFHMICNIGGVVAKAIIMRILKDCVEKNDKNYDEYALIGKIRSLVDAKTLDEVKKIGTSRFISVWYNKSTKTAEVESTLLTKETMDELKLRKKTHDALEKLFTDIFGTDLNAFKYRAKLINIPETDAKLHVAVSILAALDPFSNDILKKSLHSQELAAHLEVLEGYSHLYEWAAVNNVSHPKTQNNPPWNQNAAANGPTQIEYTKSGKVKLDSNYFTSQNPSRARYQPGYNSAYRPSVQAQYQPGYTPVYQPSGSTMGLKPRQ